MDVHDSVVWMKVSVGKEEAREERWKTTEKNKAEKEEKREFAAVVFLLTVMKAILEKDEEKTLLSLS